MQKWMNNVMQESNSVAKNIVLLGQARLEVVDRELNRAPFTSPHVSQTYSDAHEKHHNIQDYDEVYTSGLEFLCGRLFQFSQPP
jgi:hypothetical protein